MTIKLFCDGNASVGFGHIRRSLSLFNYLQREKFDVCIIGLSEEASHQLPRANNQNIVDVYTLAIIDSPFDVTELVSQLQQQKIKVICLDSQSLIAPELTISIFEHSKSLPKGNRVSGYEYVIIRDDFLRLNKRAQAENSNRVLVAVGGADIKQHSLLAVNKLLQWKYQVDLILGPFSRQIKPIVDDNLMVHFSPHNFAELLNQCSWAVINGGGSLFESLYLDKAVFVLPQTDAELRIADDLRNEKTLLGIGIEQLENSSPDKIAQQLASFQKANGTSLIDGKGLQRISRHIEELLSE